MSRSRGTGQPVWFRCSQCRRHRAIGGFASDVSLTGRTRPKCDGNAGMRSTTTEREYKCSCGHVGWSRHVDLEDKERRTKR